MERYENKENNIYPFADNKLKLEVAKQEVELMTDKLGLGIDDGIKETIAIFRAMDFPTSSSCAGHTEKDKYSPPYIEVYQKAPNGWKEDKEVQSKWRKENLNHKLRLQKLLDHFYINRNTTPDAKLYLSNMGIFGGFRLEPQGNSMKAEELGIKNLEGTIKKIKYYQQEMNAFTDFLKRLFIGKP